MYCRFEKCHSVFVGRVNRLFLFTPSVNVEQTVFRNVHKKLKKNRGNTQKKAKKKNDTNFVDEKDRVSRNVAIWISDDGK
jgi:stalled ribosome alternative rescue factor ArfA